MTRSYGFNTASDRTSLTSYDPDSNGDCQTTTGTTTSWTYDTADRVDASGYVYDSLGRTTTVPASDTGNPGGGDVTATYHVTDLVRSIVQGGRTTTYTVDVNGERVRSWDDSDGSTTTTRTHHYSGDDDSPDWTDESGSTWTRTIVGLNNLAAITTTYGTTDTDWQLVNLHGDCVATVHNSDLAVTTTSETTEYGQMRDPAHTGTQRYGWLGAKQRAADTPPGVLLMGVRLYNPTLGRFAQTDPVHGGSANRYDYCYGDPNSCVDIEGKAPYGCYMGYYPQGVPASVRSGYKRCLEFYERRRKAIDRAWAQEVRFAKKCLRGVGVSSAYAHGTNLLANIFLKLSKKS